MTFVVPQEQRFQLVAVVNDAPLAAGAERDMIFRAARENMVRKFAGYTVEKCIQQSSYMGFGGSTLHMDVYVLSPQDLHALIDNAYRAGLNSRDRFAHLNFNYTEGNL